MSLQLNFSVTSPLLEALDDWRHQQRDVPTRPEAVRRIVAEAILFGSPLAEERKRMNDIRNNK
jgi:hypothetical protein